MPEEIEAEALVELLNAAGTPISRAQLRRLHKAGLTQRPRPAGRGKGRGSRSYYPISAVEQVKAATELLSKRRDFKWVGWRLWLRGFDVDRRYWREPIER